MGVEIQSFPKDALRLDEATARIKHAPPLMFHLRRHQHKKARDNIIQALEMYRGTFDDHHRVLLDRFRLHDLAIKVVGVGSVGTACMVVLFMAGDDDPLFLQVKQANASVLEPYAGESHGPAPDTGSKRHDARLDRGRIRWTPLLCAPAPRHESLGDSRNHGTRNAKDIGQFAAAYADQTESDYRLMRKAARDGRIDVAVME